MAALKVAVLGGGSTYTPELVEGFIRYHHELPIRQIVLMDISQERLKIIGDLARRMIGDCGIDLVTTTDRLEAIRDSDFVLTQMRIGGLQARALDERIPLEHGVLGQETTGPGGFTKGLRTIPVVIDIAKDVAKYAPNAWLINFTNPAGMVTEAVSRYTDVNVIGLCNVPINMRLSVAKFLDVPPERVELDYVGLNHLSWARVIVDNRDVTAEVLEMHWGSSGGHFDMDYLRAIGMIPNYYIRYFAHPDRVIAEQHAADQVRGEYLQGLEAELFDIYKDPNLYEKPKLLEERGGAHYSTVAVELIRSIAHDRRDVHIVNVRNGSSVTELPPEAVVEIPAVIGRSGARPLISKPLPPSIRGLITSVKAFEELTIEAAMTGDEQTAKMALFSHPLVPSWDVATAIWKDAKVAHQAYLPQFK